MKTLEKIIWGIALSAGIFGAFAFVYAAYLRIQYPYMLNLGEPSLAQNIRVLFEGKVPYHDLHEPPYSLVPYGPTYLALAALLKKIWAAPFVAGRVVGLFSTAVAAFFIFLILIKKTKNTAIGVLAALFFLSHAFIWRWGVQVNVDMTAVMLGAAAFFFFYCYLEERADKKLFLAGILFSLLAFFTKSSSLSAPAAFFFYLVVNKRFREAFSFAGILGVCVLAVYAALYVWTGGQYFYHTNFEIMHRLFFATFIARFWFTAFQVAWLPVLATLFFLILGLRKTENRFFFLYLIFSVLLTTSLGKQGSDTNYFLEWCIASTLALGILVQESEDWKHVLVLTFIAAQLIVWIYPNRDFQKMKTEFQENKAFYDKLSVNIRKVKGEILSEDLGLLIANDKEIVYEPFPMGQMSYSKVWNQELILEKLNHQDFSLAILYFYAPALKANRTFTPEFLEAFKKNYHFIGRVPYPWDKSKNPQNLFFYSPNSKG